MSRRGAASRKTRETSIQVAVDLDGDGRSEVSTGIGFLDHMLELLSVNSLIDMRIETEGDLHVDEHHTVEDVAITLGMAIADALEERRGIRRYGFVLPMDEALARVALDLGGRPFVVFEAEFTRDKVGDLPTELVEDFIRGLAQHMGANIHVQVEYGRNDHHRIEALFKALGRALRAAIEEDPRLENQVPSTKGVL